MSVWSVRSLGGWCGVALCLAATSLLAASPSGAVGGYGDVPADRYFTEPVQWSVDNDISNIGGNCFLPDEPVSRGETALYLWSMEGQPAFEFGHSFVDVTVEAQNAAITWLSETETTTGTSDTEFSPQNTLRRAEIAAFLHRLAGEPDADPHPFVDVLAGWQQAPVSWLVASGITTGTSPTTFSPDDRLTRAQLVTLLWRYQGKPEVTVDPSSPVCDSRFNAVSAGWYHSCGLRSDDTINCWGANVFGEADAPEGSFKAVAGGGFHSCGLRSDNTITCWGDNRFGETDAPEGSFKAITSGGYHSCGLRTDDTITCWGDNPSGRADAPEGSFKAVTAGGLHSCGLRNDDTITCWGTDTFEQAAAPEGSFKAIATGSTHSCGLHSDDTITCWGDNRLGQADAPTGSFKAVTAGGLHSCGLRSNDTITCWGENVFGEAVAPEGSFKAVTAGYGHSCAMSSDDSIICWGPVPTPRGVRWL